MDSEKKLTKKQILTKALATLNRRVLSSSQLYLILTDYYEKYQQIADQSVIDDVLFELKKTGLLNDHLLALSRARGLIIKGKSLKFIYQDLRYTKKIEEDIIAKAIDDLEEEYEDIDLYAAKSYARKKKLGNFSSKKLSEDEKNKHIQKLIRLGFEGGVVRQALFC